MEAGARVGTPLYLIATLPALPRVDAAVHASLASDPLVARRLDEIAAAEALAQVRRALLDGDLARAKALLAGARARFVHSEWVGDVLSTMERTIDERESWLSAKEASFSALKMRRRLASLTEPEFTALDPNDIPRFLRRKTQQGRGEAPK